MKETLEEAADKFAKTTIPENKFEEGLCVGKSLGFIEGAKWQQEKMYSEEDILDAWELGAKEELPLTKEKKERLFKQFKKK